VFSRAYPLAVGADVQNSAMLPPAWRASVELSLISQITGRRIESPLMSD
jgi:hypothetical protein